MNENEQNFEPLRRLLALKRYETPPLGYFNNFSRQVLARIRAGEVETSASLADRLGISWLLKWIQAFETTPAYAGSFATVLCLLLLFGAIMAQRPEGPSQAFLQPAARETAPLPMVATATPMAPPTLEQPSGQIMVEDNSTNPVINFQNPSLALGQTPFSAQFVNYPVSGN
jgi:hypothetical protein